MRGREGISQVKPPEFCPSKSLEIPDKKLLLKNPKNNANPLEFTASSLCDDPSVLPDDVNVILDDMGKDKVFQQHRVLFRIYLAKNKRKWIQV